jgi:uncharacterized protein
MTWVLITGASRGLGRALARTFAKGGFHLVLAARNAGQLETLAHELRTEHNVTIHVLGCDLATENGPQSLIELCRDKSLEIGAVINNAALLPHGASHTLSPRIAREVIHLNIRAATELTLAFVPGMVAQGRGAIMNISSLASMAPLQSAGLYSASKSYLSVFSRAMHRDLAGTGVVCLDVTLGPMRTSMLTGEAGTANTLGRFRWLAIEPQSAADIIYDG